MRRQWLVVLFATSMSLSASAQTTDGGYDKALSPSLANVAKSMHAMIRRNLADAAEGMSEADFAFRPTAAVRTFGQLVGHIANSNFFFCSQAASEQPPTTTNYEAVVERVRLLAGLTASLAYCDTVYGATTDANFNRPVSMGSGSGMPPTDTVRGAVLTFNVAHNNEHYGNVVVYMRLRGKVPPSTARAQGAK